jgi:hypothetical protein
VTRQFFDVPRNATTLPLLGSKANARPLRVTCWQSLTTNVVPLAKTAPP